MSGFNDGQSNSRKREVYLWDEKQTQSNRDGEVGVGEEQQQHPVWIKLIQQGESVKETKTKSTKTNFS